MHRVIAVDIGGTQVRVGMVDASGHVVQRSTRATAATDGVGGLAAMIAELDSTGDEPAVIGLPGRVDYDAGLLETGVNLPAGWVAEFRQDALEQRLGREVQLANDADLAAVGEAWFGAGAGHADVLYVTLSTGIGAGLILGRRLVAGRRSSAELGHTIIDFDGSQGGRPRTVEDLGSGTALGREAADVGLPDGAELVALVQGGDAAATAVWRRTVRAAAIGIANMCWLAAPSVVIVGGGMGRNGDLVLQPIRDAMASVGPADLATEITVTQAHLGDDAGLSGAAAWRDALGPRGS